MNAPPPPAAVFFLGVITMLVALPIAGRSYHLTIRIAKRHVSTTPFHVIDLLALLVAFAVGAALALAPLPFFDLLPLRQNARTYAPALLTGFVLSRVWQWSVARKAKSIRAARLQASIEVDVEERKRQSKTSAGDEA